MLELILKIREHTEAGSILEHMELFEPLEEYFKPMDDEDKESEDANKIPGVESVRKPYDMMQNKEVKVRCKECGITRTIQNNDNDYFCGACGWLNNKSATNYKMVKQSCDNCIYWMDDFCSNEVVCDIFSDIDIKGNWCDQWRSEDEVVRDDDE